MLNPSPFFFHKLNTCTFVSSVSINPFLQKFLRFIQTRSLGGVDSPFTNLLHPRPELSPPISPDPISLSQTHLLTSLALCRAAAFGLPVSILAPTAPSWGCGFRGMDGCKGLRCSGSDPPAAPALPRPTAEKQQHRVTILPALLHFWMFFDFCTEQFAVGRSEWGIQSVVGSQRSSCN